MLSPFHVLKGKWRIIKKINAGAFGEIYLAEGIAPPNEQVAVKVERNDGKKAVLKMEVAVLKHLQGTKYVCKYHNCGRVGVLNYIVMELVGRNLSDMRKHQPEQRFSLPTAMRLAVLMLRGVQSVHEAGYLHRDVKPSNFSLGLPGTPKEHHLYVIDFGLARKYRTLDGTFRPPRSSVGFRGTARYASVNAHLARELAPRDDLWSWLYVIMEFLAGHLPWRRIKDRTKIGTVKIELLSRDLVRGFPPEVGEIYDYIHRTHYGTIPDYDLLVSICERCYKRHGFGRETLFDWELKVPIPRYVIGSEKSGDSPGKGGILHNAPLREIPPFMGLSSNPVGVAVSSSLHSDRGGALDKQDGVAKPSVSPASPVPVPPNRMKVDMPMSEMFTPSSFNGAKGSSHKSATQERRPGSEMAELSVSTKMSVAFTMADSVEHDVKPGFWNGRQRVSPRSFLQPHLILAQGQAKPDYFVKHKPRNTWKVENGQAAASFENVDKPGSGLRIPAVVLTSAPTKDGDQIGVERSAMFEAAASGFVDSKVRKKNPKAVGRAKLQDVPSPGEGDNLAGSEVSLPA